MPEAMDQGKFLITGVVGDQAPPRLEINDFICDSKQLALYIQALDAMYSEVKKPMLSYFEISAIHGRPFQDWNGAPSDGKTFCVHGTNLFPTWHRPYVALIEQILQSHAVRIAKQYAVDCEEWKLAADNLRQPYWDWATNSVPPDIIISEETVRIPRPPHGVETNVANPFFRYRFRDGERSNFSSPVREWQYTVRHPTSTGEKATSDILRLKLLLRLGQEQLKYDTSRLFSIHDWDLFSTTGLSGGNTNSLEEIHNKIHIDVGGHVNGGGHMGHIVYAAFDPIFYLHHSQVDRLVSLWSYIHNLWVPEQDTNKDLNPFWKTQSTYWQSTDVRNSTTLNYTYPDFLDGATASEVSRSISKLYRGSAFDPLSSLLSLDSSQASNPITEWTARVHCKQFELGGSFSVLIFIGRVPTDPIEWYESHALAGTIDAFVNDTPEECPNCQDHTDMVFSGYVHLNAAISRHYEANFNPDYVVPRLTSDLAWRVLKVDGTAVELPSLEIVVMATPLTLPEGANFPVVGQPVFYRGITRGKSGGSRD